MFNMKDFGDLTKLAAEAQEMERKQNFKHQEQIQLLSRIANSLDEILREMKANNAR